MLLNLIEILLKISEDQVIAKYIIQLTHELNFKIVAEGIETEEHLEFLKLNNCEYGQGYLFSKPITKEKFEELLILDKSY